MKESNSRFDNPAKNFLQYIKVSQDRHIYYYAIINVIILSFFIIFSIKAKDNPEYAVPWSFCAPGLIICLSVLFWISFYRSNVLITLRISQLQDKYSLSKTLESPDYISKLNKLFDYIDAFLAQENTNQFRQRQAELTAMQNQINPHFLYNTLDTIRGYAVIEKAPITADMVEVLSRLFRYMISQKNMMTTIQQELNILQDYIKIQEYRLNHHIVYLQNIDKELDIMNYRIPKLIIQPFIENAVKHGFEGNLKEFIITLHIFSTQSRLIISISDNGVGMSAMQLKELNQKLTKDETASFDIFSDNRSGNSIALENVNLRIQLTYGKSYGIIAYSTPNEGSEFQISLPKQSTQKE